MTAPQPSEAPTGDDHSTELVTTDDQDIEIINDSTVRSGEVEPVKSRREKLIGFGKNALKVAGAIATAVVAIRVVEHLEEQGHDVHRMIDKD